MNSPQLPVLPPEIRAGNLIEHRLVPGFTMRVQEIRDCEISPSRPEPHKQFKITGPDGNTDWLCAYDVQRTGENLPWS